MKTKEMVNQHIFQYRLSTIQLNQAKQNILASKLFIQ